MVPGMTAKPFFTPGRRSQEKMCGAMKGAVTGRWCLKDWRKGLDEAAELAASGRSPSRRATSTTVRIDGGRHLGTSMFMHIVKNKTYGNIAYTNMSEQMAKILRMGANDQSVIDRLNWIRDVRGQCCVTR